MLPFPFKKRIFIVLQNERERKLSFKNMLFVWHALNVSAGGSVAVPNPPFLFKPL